MEIVGVHPWVADCWGSLFGCDPPVDLPAPSAFSARGRSSYLERAFSLGLGGKVSLPSPPLLAYRPYLQELIGGPHACYSLLRVTFRPIWCSPPLPVSVRYFGVPSLLAPLVVFGAARPPSLVLLVSPTRGYGAGVAWCLARAPWFARVGRDPVPCPPVQNGLWGGAGGEVSR